MKWSYKRIDFLSNFAALFHVKSIMVGFVVVRGSWMYICSQQVMPMNKERRQGQVKFGLKIPVGPIMSALLLKNEKSNLLLKAKGFVVYTANCNNLICVQIKLKFFVSSYESRKFRKRNT